MFYCFLIDSLDAEFKMMVLLYPKNCTVNSTHGASALLKQIIILTQIDNPAAASHVRDHLIDSKKKLLLLQGSITKLNKWVCKQVSGLHLREQETMDLSHYLWKAYKAAPDEELNTYIKDMKSQADDGRATFNTKQLMPMVENKYEVHLLDDENEWGKLSDEQEQTIAMNAKINGLKNN